MYIAPTYFSANINELPRSSPPPNAVSPSPEHPYTLTPGEYGACNSTAAATLLPSLF